MTQAALTRLDPASGPCLLCCRPVGAAERCCPAFALAGVAAHAGCCGGCVRDPARPELAHDELAATTAGPRRDAR